jgi:hypothetical protein
VSFSRNFYCEKSPRGYVTAGISGTEIEIVIEMDPEKKHRISSQPVSPENAAQWAAAMDDLAKRAEWRVRKAWKEHRERKRR